MTVGPVKYYKFHDFRLYVENQELLKDGIHLPLTHKAFQVLQLLVENAGHTTSKVEIFEQLWCGSFVEDANLTQHIHVLRKVMGTTPDGGSYVQTVPRFGYRFALTREQVVTVCENDAAGSLSRATPVDPRPRWFQAGRPRSVFDSAFRLAHGVVQRASGNNPFRHAATAELPSPKRRLGVRILLLITGMFLILEIVATPTYYYFRGAAQPASVPQQSSAIRSIAVMPFKPIGEKVDKEKLGFGMTDAVITHLSKIKQVSVRPTSAVSRFVEEPSTDSSAAGRALSVDGVLEGMVQCDGESVRVSVQLIRVEDGKPMWAESFHEKLSDSFTMQDSISSKVALSLSNNLAQPDVVAHSPFSEVPDPEAVQTNE